MRRNRAFTLIELLVVVAIICVIIATLAPVLTVAKEMARRAVCAANQHNNHAAFMVYATDWNGMLPRTGPHYYCDYYISYSDANVWVQKYFGGNIGSLYCPSIILYLKNMYNTPAASPQWWWTNIGAGSSLHGILYDIHTNPGPATPDSQGNTMFSRYGIAPKALPLPPATPDPKSQGYYLKSMEDSPRMALCNDIISPVDTSYRLTNWNWAWWSIAHRGRGPWNTPPPGGNVGTLGGDVKWKSFSRTIANLGGIVTPPTPNVLTRQYAIEFWAEWW